MAVKYPSDPAVSSEEIRLTGTSFAVLTLIELLGPSTPYDLKQALERSIANFWMVPHTTFYAEPERLAGGGFLSVSQEQGGRRRKVYSITPAGAEALARWRRSDELSPPQLREEGVLKIFAGADPVPIFRRRRDWQKAKLAELEGYLDAVGHKPEWRGVRASLLVGVAYNRMLLEAMDAFLDAQAATDSPDAQAATGSS